MHGAAQGVDNCEQQLGFFTKAKVRPRTRASERKLSARRKRKKLITMMVNTRLRALQKINKAKRLDGEAVMSAPSFFQSAGRGDYSSEERLTDLLLWYGKIYRNWSRSSGRKSVKSKDWVVWCRSRPKDEEQRPFEVNVNEIFSNCSKQINAKAGEKTDKKGGKGQSVRWKAYGWHDEGRTLY